MSRIRLFGASVVAVLAGAGVAVAADFPVYEAGPSPAPAYGPTAAFSWSGPYVGLTGGYGLGGSSISNNGWIGGAYAGADFQTDGNLVVGVEGDFTATGKSGTSGGTTISNPWNATARGRIGYAMDRTMVYGTGGVAVGSVKNTTGGTTEKSTEIGWTAGAGVEAALINKVTGRLEYRYTSFGTVTFPTNPTVTYKSNDVMAGVGIKF